MYRKHWYMTWMQEINKRHFSSQRSKTKILRYGMLWWMTWTSKHQLFSSVSNITVEPLTYAPIYIYIYICLACKVILPKFYDTWNILKTMCFMDILHELPQEDTQYIHSYFQLYFYPIPIILPYILFQF